MEEHLRPCGGPESGQTISCSAHLIFLQHPRVSQIYVVLRYYRAYVAYFRPWRISQMSSQPLLGAPALVVEKREKSSLNTTLRFTLLRSILALSIIILSLILRSIVACQFFSRESWGNVPLSQSSDCIAVPNILYISASLVVFVHHFTRWASGNTKPWPMAEF